MAPASDDAPTPDPLMTPDAGRSVVVQRRVLPVRNQGIGLFAMVAESRKMPAENHKSEVLMVSFLLWCVLLTYPLMTVSETYGPDNLVILYQVVGWGQYLIVAAGLFAPRILPTIFKYDYLQGFVLLAFFLSIGLQLHGEGTLVLGGIAYTIAMMVTISLLSLIFTLPGTAITRCMGGAAWLCLGFAVLAIVLFGWPQDRYIGKIQPNLLGSILLSGFIFSQFCKGFAMRLLQAACVVFTAAVSSRFALIGCILAFLFFEMTFKPVNLKVALLIALAALGFALFYHQIPDLLAFKDPDRGVNSGFTGRTDEWRSAFEILADNPFGLGFKRAGVGEGGHNMGHNGYLKVLLEFGVLGGVLINLAVVGIVLRALLTAIVLPGHDISRRRFACARAAGLVALAFASFFQPQIFNLGDVHGISFTLLLFAPAYLTARQFVSGGSAVPNPIRPAWSRIPTGSSPLSNQGLAWVSEDNANQRKAP